MSKKGKKQSDITNERAKLLGALQDVKQQHPELDEILQQFQISQAEYDATMLSIISSQIETHSTYTTT